MAGTGSSKQVDPIAYRVEEQGPITENTQVWGFEPDKLKNADVNISKYGDDSSAANYNNPDLWGGENTKYQGVNTKNTSVAYDPNATLENLNPNYAYGQKAQMVNSGDAGYIQRRNDQIASALYNAGKTSIQDVSDFLYKQKGFENSEENERKNTIASVWKRLGEISSNRGQNENNGGINEQAVKDMEKDLTLNTDGEIYGKNTADWRGEDRAIKTLKDAYNVEQAVNNQRISNFKNLQAMTASEIAISVVTGTNPYGNQGMRDLMMYDPTKYAEVQRKIKEYLTQKNMDEISMGNGYDYETTADNTDEKIENDIKGFAENNGNTDSEVDEIIKSLNESMNSNKSAQTAEDSMRNIQADINKLKTRLKNLNKEASSIFRGDVPQYIVNAYKANRTKEIQDKINELQDDYNAAYDRYKTELANEQRTMEYDLKKKQYDRDYALSVRKLDLSEKEYELNAYKAQQDVLLTQAKLDNENTFTDKNGKVWEWYKDSEGNRLVREVPVLRTFQGTGMGGKGAKNNNPGNITDMGFGNPIGNDGKFAIFATPEDGFDALLAKIKYNQTNPSSKYYGSTIWEYTHIYAPKQDKNDPENYANQMANALGVTVDTKIADLDPLAMAKFIAKKESGYNYDTYGQFRGNDTSADNYDYSDSPILANLADAFTENAKLGTQEYNTIKEIIGGDDWRRKRDQYYDNYINDLYGDQTDIVPRADGNAKLLKVIRADKDDNTPIAFKQRIYNLVPGTLKNSENELKNLYKIAKDLYNDGYTADEASLIFFGIDLRNDKTGMGYPLVMAARQNPKLPDTFYGGLAGYLENNELEKAVSLVDNTVLANEGDLITDTIAFVDKLNNLEDTIEDAEGSLGPISGRFNETWTKYVGNKDYARVKAAMNQAFSQLENTLMGSNITEGESKRYEGMIPKATDKVSTIKEKISEAKKAALIDLNAARKKYNLPALTEETLSDYTKRGETYRNILGTNSKYGNKNNDEVIIDIDNGNEDDDDYEWDS